jgi:hypothetical protein
MRETTGNLTANIVGELFDLLSHFVDFLRSFVPAIKISKFRMPYQTFFGFIDDVSRKHFANLLGHVDFLGNFLQKGETLRVDFGMSQVDNGIIKEFDTEL